MKKGNQRNAVNEPKRYMFSRQGKAINHLFPNYFATPLKRPGVIEKSQEELTPAGAVPKINMSSSFKAISRDQYEHSKRDRTVSPRVGFYNPQWQITRPRSAQAPKIKQTPTKSRPKKIFFPKCITKDLHCSFPHRITNEKSLPGPFIDKLKRTMSNLQDYVEKTEENQKKTEEAFSKTKDSWLTFENQLDRKEFVSKSDPPHPDRFSFVQPSSLIYSNNKKVKTFLISKFSSRKQLFDTGLTLGPYDKDEEKLMPKLNNSYVEFGKMTDRKELVLEHRLSTPNAPNLENLDKAFCQQSGVRGATNIPLMATVTPRDDLMYRVTEAYNLNVPQIQSAESPAKYLGETSLKSFKSQLIKLNE